MAKYCTVISSSHCLLSVTCWAFFSPSGFPPQSSLSHIKIGDKVRVKPTVTTPKYKWGSVTHRSVGVVKGETVSASLPSHFDFDSIYKVAK